ncbi:Rad1-domain-containing protein [Neolentinus lepideus HHB14362 ss-1]|uniref:Rad1-domain-containing protein n=1 Tax=Neolentinus lepideus HHB14362 ss-1 TaxID=1314782 RepID=A0A165NY20_9AGAM|nr:Rad1-domain-containing protein [Neolentinus lepideus HHB14362 ss-1]
MPSASNNNAAEELAKPVFIASCHDVRYLVALLRGISFSNKATVTAHESGLTFSVEEARTMTGASFVDKRMFDEYQYNDPGELVPTHSQEGSSVAFEIRLSTLIECLNIFGTAGLASGSKFKKPRNVAGDADDDSDGAGGTLDKFFHGNTKGTGMRMSYAGSGYPLTLVLAESSSGPTATCEITTFDSDPEGRLELEVDNTDIPACQSSWLRDALSELDPSCEKLTFVGNPLPQGNNTSRSSSSPLFRILAEGMFGSTEMDYPNDREVLETFNCEEPTKFSYRFSHITKTLKALQASIKTALRIDSKGALGMQFLMPSGQARNDDGILFVDFQCMPLDDRL